MWRIYYYTLFMYNIMQCRYSDKRTEWGYFDICLFIDMTDPTRRIYLENLQSCLIKNFFIISSLWQIFKYNWFESNERFGSLPSCRMRSRCRYVYLCVGHCSKQCCNGIKKKEIILESSSQTQIHNTHMHYCCLSLIFANCPTCCNLQNSW